MLTVLFNATLVLYYLLVVLLMHIGKCFSASCQLMIFLLFIFFSQSAYTDARHRSGSLAAGSSSAASLQQQQQQQQQQVHRSASINVASMFTGSRHLNSKGNIFRQRKDFSAFQVVPLTFFRIPD